MTREEALQILDTIPTIGEQVDALEMAIEALEKEPILDKIRAEIEQELYDIFDDKDLDLGKKYAFERTVEIIDKYKAESEVKQCLNIYGL